MSYMMQSRSRQLSSVAILMAIGTMRVITGICKSTLMQAFRTISMMVSEDLLLTSVVNSQVSFEEYLAMR